MNDSPTKIVLTGASRGIGLALAREFVRLGHVVQGCSRSGVPHSREPFSVCPVDVSDRGQVACWVEQLVGAGFVPDIVITNAGLINEPAPLWKIPPAEVQALMDTNVLGTAYVLQAFLPLMIVRGRGMIVSLSSGWGRYADVDFAPYCASKFAVEGLISSLSKELPGGLAAVTLSPGIVRTDMLFRCWGEQALDYELPDAWAKRAAPFILGLDARHNGQSLTVPTPPDRGA